MSDASTSDLDTTIAQKAQRKCKSHKKKSKRKSTADEPKNEGHDPHWAYTPPDGAVLLDHAVDSGPFDWDALKDDDTELWLLRVPDTLNPKHLAHLALDPPTAAHTAHIGSLARKSTSYDVWSLAPDDADELRGLACLVPRARKQGRLYLAPKEVSHHIVVTGTPSTATPPEVVDQRPSRRSYPKEVLTHSFVPYGARSQKREDASMDVDVETQAKPVSDAAKEKPKSKGKKRKVEGETPKKSKKHKTDS